MGIWFGAVAAGVGMLFLPGARADSGPVRALSRGEVLEVTATKQKPGGEPGLVNDRMTNTAWITGTTGCGKGHSITLRFKERRYLTHVSIMPGLAGNNRMFKMHARPASVLVSWADGSQMFEMKDRRKSQRLKLANLARTRFLTIEIDSTYNCRQDRTRNIGLAISEIMVWEPKDILGVDEALANRITRSIRDLKDPDAGERKLAEVVAYGRAAIPLLREQVRKGHTVGAPNALAALTRLDPKRAKAVIGKLLRSKWTAKQTIALKALALQSLPGVSGPLLYASRNKNPTVGAMALDALGASLDPEALVVLEKALESGDPLKITVAVSRLPGYRARGLQVCERLLANGDTSSRLAALATLGGFEHDANAVDMLKPFARGRDSLLRLAAIRSLGRSSSPYARIALEQLVSGKDSRAAEAALGALILSGDSVGDLMESLLSGDNTNPSLARSLMKYMARTRTAEVRAILINAITAELQPVWYPSAQRALISHGRAGAKALMKHLVEHPTQASRVMPYLERAAKEIVAPVNRALRHLPGAREYDDLREVLIKSLAQAQDPRAARTVIQLYENATTSERIRLVAIKAMGDIPSDEGRDLVLAGIDSHNRRLATLAIEAAGKMGERRAVPILMKRLRERGARDWDPRVIRALGQLRAKEALPLFREHRNYLGRPVQLAILRACKLIGGRDGLQVLIDASVSQDAAVSRLAGNLLSE